MAMRIGSVVCAISLGVGFDALAAQGEPEPTPIRYAVPTPTRDGVPYPVGQLEYVYPFIHPDLPNLEVLDDLVVVLSPVVNGWISASEGSDLVAVRLGDIGSDGVEIIYGSALATIDQAIRDYLEAEYGLIGHLVTPSASEIAYRTTRADLRPAGETTLTIMVWRAVVGEVRTVARGNRLAERPTKNGEEPESNINRDEHQRVRDRLRVEPGALLTRKELDDEVARLSRHPGRRADVAIAPSDKPGEVVVDYLLSESKVWSGYVQTSNTGTASTADWQQRFGFVNRQLTGRDDVLKLDYITTGFDQTNAVLGSYSFDLGPHARAKLYGRWNEYTARDVGFGFENFKGSGFSLGAEAAINVWQDGARFVDVVVGARVENIKVENLLFGFEGEDDFLLPYVGVRYERRTPIHSALGELIVETNWGSVVGSSKGEVQRLGRFGADDDFTILRGQLTHSFYLEPFFNPDGFRGDHGTDEMTLAHELLVSLRGQYSFQSRLVPNYEFVAGGFYTVRGYPESAAVGDDAILGSVEYRYHLGRAMAVSPEMTSVFGRPFRTARARPYGSADWDVILKGFVDVARLGVNDAPFFEQAETLVGIGVGIETQLRSNVSLRLDYGMALTNIGQGAGQTTEVGDTRLHFSAQFVF
jgi:hemolysin activation/secretion protein